MGSIHRGPRWGGPSMLQRSQPKLLINTGLNLRKHMECSSACLCALGHSTSQKSPRLIPQRLFGSTLPVSVCKISLQSLDELDDDDGEEKERKMEESLTQHNTVQNEAMTSDPGAAHSIQDTPRSRSHKSDEDGNRHRHRHEREGSGAAPTTLERRIEELERELAVERQETSRLLKAHQDNDELIVKLKEEIELLNRDLDDIEDENEQLKQENKTLLKVVGQLTR
ncbi:PRKC apoptosis WT1 regulator protein-like [Sinocyclocheilus anshuiensis]|uniref:PRKC apoptosis WT1 regulator protein-like n=1 Tax=Sinocyclocheilus anshuiensis TaxID=1608454 RepID=UPI0007B80EDB|nr:PREDICTED: PRKC apoptosis WT1 regulator protein-like [Sinocyclocheilus anshuiensis]